jgi:hypothetical protein
VVGNRPTTALRTNLKSFAPLFLVILACSACPKDEPVGIDAGPNLPSRCQAGDEWIGDTPAFQNKASEWGITDLVVKGTRINVLDYNNDGWPDLLVRNGSGPDEFTAEGSRQRWLLKNTGSGQFVDATQESGLFTSREGIEGALMGDVVVAGDINNDGLTDIFIAVSSEDGSTPSELRLGQADGGFIFASDASDARRVGQTSVPSGLSLTDADRDGWIDLWMTQNKTGTQQSPMADNLYFGDGQGGFRDMSVPSSIQSRN